MIARIASTAFYVKWREISEQQSTSDRRFHRRLKGILARRRPNQFACCPLPKIVATGSNLCTLKRPVPDNCGSCFDRQLSGNQQRPMLRFQSHLRAADAIEPCHRLHARRLNPQVDDATSFWNILILSLSLSLSLSTSDRALLLSCGSSAAGDFTGW